MSSEQKRPNLPFKDIFAKSELSILEELPAVRDVRGKLSSIARGHNAEVEMARGEQIRGQRILFLFDEDENLLTNSFTMEYASKISAQKRDYDGNNFKLNILPNFRNNLEYWTKSKLNIVLAMRDIDKIPDEMLPGQMDTSSTLFEKVAENINLHPHMTLITTATDYGRLNKMKTLGLFDHLIKMPNESEVRTEAITAYLARLTIQSELQQTSTFKYARRYNPSELSALTKGWGFERLKKFFENPEQIDRESDVLTQADIVAHIQRQNGVITR